jgi:hypothetical protein
MFKRNDKVICIEPGKTKLRYGIEYIVSHLNHNSVTKNKYTVSLKEIPTNSYKYTRFITTERCRKLKLEKICSRLEKK